MSLVQEYELLRRVPFFAEIEPARLKLLAFMSERVGYRCRQDAVPARAMPADAAYLIIEGEADILVETPTGPLTIATLGANDIVGEMAILCDVPRTATVRAKTRLVALRIAKEPFMRMVREFPTMAVSIMRELAHRLELTNQQLRTALSEVRELREGVGAPARRPDADRGRMSRLDSFIRRLEAQRACLDRAARADQRDRRDRAGAGARQRPHLRPSARAVSRTATSMSASARSRRIPIACRRRNG